MKTIEERVDEICRWTNQGLKDLVMEAMRELAKDQVKVCHDVVNGIEKASIDPPLIYRDEACAKILLVRIS